MGILVIQSFDSLPLPTQNPVAVRLINKCGQKQNCQLQTNAILGVRNAKPEPISLQTATAELGFNIPLELAERIDYPVQELEVCSPLTPVAVGHLVDSRDWIY